MDKIIYKQCEGCGNFFPSRNEDEKYCSKECYQEYGICMVCGNYFLKKDLLQTKKFQYCKECSDKLVYSSDHETGGNVKE